MWFQMKAAVFWGWRGSADLSFVHLLDLEWNDMVCFWSAPSAPRCHTYQCPHLNLVIKPKWGHSLWESAPMILPPWLNPSWQINFHRLPRIRTYSPSLTHICYLLLIFLHLCATLVVPDWIYDSMTCRPVHMRHVAVTLRFNPFCLHWLFLWTQDAPAFRRRLDCLFWERKKNVARRRLHDDGAGNENI